MWHQQPKERDDQKVYCGTCTATVQSPKWCFSEVVRAQSKCPKGESNATLPQQHTPAPFRWQKGPPKGSLVVERVFRSSRKIKEIYPTRVRLTDTREATVTAEANPQSGGVGVLTACSPWIHPEGAHGGFQALAPDMTRPASPKVSPSHPLIGTPTQNPVHGHGPEERREHATWQKDWYN